MRHVEAGWNALTDEERAEVEARIRAVDRTVTGRREATLPFFAFLAQVETIAIEIPLRFLPHAPEELQPLLRRQLVDEVFHSTLFARIAHELAAPDSLPPAPLPSAEQLLDTIRTEPDLAVSATLLNLVAEGWIENLFRHAATWGVADDVFATVLADEARHVEEATQYHQGLDKESAQAATARLEKGLLAIMNEPTVGLSMLELAGEDRHRDLTKDMHAMHREHLAEVGLVPSSAWEQAETMTRAMLHDWSLMERAEKVPDTPWRASARKVWDTPRDPSMQGDFDLPVGRIPKKLLTPVLVAALGRAWAKNPELNRVHAKGRIWQLPKANVGVRVIIDGTELATVVVTDADQRSVRDIGRIIMDGVAQLESLRASQKEQNLEVRPFDDRVMALADPGPASFSVALSNPGKFGLIRGAGAFSGEVAPSTDVSIGQRRKLPVWRGLGYFPAWHVNMGSLQDHRVFDGREAGLSMQALIEELRPKNLRRILKAPDTLPSDIDTPQTVKHVSNAMPQDMRMLASVGISKYIPIALGAAGVAAGVSAATYYLMQGTGAAAAGTVAGATAGTGGCHGVTASGEPCNTNAGDDDYCWRHREDA